MITIKEDYVSFETTKLLKEKGFDTPVNYEYHYKITIPQFHRKKHNFNGIEYRNCSSEWYSAPTLQMAMKWLREKDIIIVIQPEYFNGISNCSAWGVDIWANEKYEKLQGDFPSYEDACEVAIKYCLENLI